MILRPLLREPQQSVPANKPEPVWTLILASQSLDADRYLLVGQPDHARLSGAMAHRFRCEFLPTVDDYLAQAIGVHDAGWALSPFERDLKSDPPLSTSGRPQSFIRVSVEQSLAAWAGSIQAGAEISEIGEYIVSGHFSRIGRVRLKMAFDTPEDMKRVQAFVEREEERQRNVAAKIGSEQRELDRFVDLLQFCDVLSLYICAGIKQAAEFPQDFAGRRVTIRYDDGVYVTEPSLFEDTQRFHLRVRAYPSQAGQGVTELGIHVR